MERVFTQNKKLQFNHILQALRAVSVVTGCLIMAVGGAVGAFNAWSNDLKDTYDLTQSHGRYLCM